MDLKISAGPLEGDFLLKFQGELDLYATLEVNTKLKDLLQSGAKRLLLDLAGLSYLDSSGVGVFIRLLQNAAGLSVTIGVMGLGGTPKKVLELCNVITLLKLFDTPEAAWGALRKK